MFVCLIFFLLTLIKVLKVLKKGKQACNTSFNILFWDLKEFNYNNIIRNIFLNLSLNFKLFHNFKNIYQMAINSN